MLTVHKLSTNHLILADNNIAKQARETGIEEVLVVIDRGQIVGVHTPPGEADEFASDDDWIFAAIRDAYQRGLAELPPVHQNAPEGWTLWADLKPGMIATGGDPDEIAPFVALGDDDFVRGFGGRQRTNTEREAFTAIWFGQYHRSNAFTYKPHSDRVWPFFKVLRAGLTGDRMRAVVTAVESGEDIEVALANLAPVES